MKRFVCAWMLVALAAAAPAAAKSVQSVEICGESECSSVPDRDLKGHQAFDWVFGGGDGVGGEALPAGADVWRVSVTVGAGTDGGESEVLRQMVAPRAGYIRLGDAMGSSYRHPRWEPMTSRAAPEWVGLTTGIAPLERPEPDRDDAAGDPLPAGPATADASDDPAAWPLALLGGLGLIAAVALWAATRGLTAAGRRPAWLQPSLRVSTDAAARGTP